MTQPSPQPTLRDLVRPLLTHRWLLLSVAAIAVAAAVGYSLTQKPTYTARASLAFQDQSRDLGLLGIPLAPTQTAAQLATASAQSLTQPKVLAMVKKSLNTSMTGAQLAKAISTTVDASSNLVSIQADSPTAYGAQRLANAFARQGAAVTNDQARATYAAAVRELRTSSPSTRDAQARAIYSEQISRLQALSTIASPAGVVELARRPNSPSSPKTLRNGVLGGLLGVILGLLAVFARDSFDRRLRTSSEIQGELGLTLIGHVRDDALGHNPIPGSKRGVSAEEWELFRILRQNLDFLDPAGAPKTVAVTSAVPQEGKTTVAAFLAFASAAAGKRTLLIEADLRRPVLAERLGIEAAPGVTDYVAGTADPAAVVQTMSFSDAVSPNGAKRPAEATSDPAFTRQIACITAGSRTAHPAEVLRSERFRQMLTEVEAAYDVVVIDTPPVLAVVDTLELIPNVAALVVCVRALTTTRDQALAGKAALDRLPPRPTGLVVTGTRRQDEAEYGYYGYY